MILKYMCTPSPKSSGIRTLKAGLTEDCLVLRSVEQVLFQNVARKKEKSKPLKCETIEEERRN
jgi:hypothetical protein